MNQLNFYPISQQCQFQPLNFLPMNPSKVPTGTEGRLHAGLYNRKLRSERKATSTSLIDRLSVIGTFSIFYDESTLSITLTFSNFHCCACQGCKKSPGIELLVGCAYEDNTLTITWTNCIIKALKQKKLSK